MSVDTIGNMLSQIKNASMVNKEFVEFPHSKMREAILKVLEKYNYVDKVKTFKEKGAPHKSLHVDLAYDKKGNSKIREIKRISKPGRRLYTKKDEIKGVSPKYELTILSTSKGVMASVEAQKKNLGGQVICKVI